MAASDLQISSPYACGVPDAVTVRLLKLVAGICLLEALTLLVLGVVEVASLDRGRLTLGVTTSVFLFVYAAALCLAGVGAARLHSWTRAPIVLSQLIQLGLAWSLHGGATTVVSVLLAVPAVVALVIMLRPRTTAALYGEQAVG